METDDAGLELIKNIRNKLKNKTTRIVLRTGQPGLAPEREIIREYEISDYKNKTELSGLKLDTLMCSALRSYQKIVDLNKTQAGLELVIESSSVLSEAITYESLIDETMNYLTNFSNIDFQYSVMDDLKAIKSRRVKIDNIIFDFGVNELLSKNGFNKLLLTKSNIQFNGSTKEFKLFIQFLFELDNHKKAYKVE
jgi:hypothetical protein